MSEGSEWALCIYSSKKPLSYTESRAHALIHLGEPMKIETRKNQRDFANLTGILIGLCVGACVAIDWHIRKATNRTSAGLAIR